MNSIEKIGNKTKERIIGAAISSTLLLSLLSLNKDKVQSAKNNHLDNHDLGNVPASNLIDPNPVDCKVEELSYPNQTLSFEQVDEYFDLLEENDCINVPYLTEEERSEEIEIAKKALLDGGNTALLPQGIFVDGFVTLGRMNINGKTSSFGIIPKDADVIVRQQDVQSIIEQGSLIGVSPVGCVWDWDNDPATYSCASITHKK